MADEEFLAHYGVKGMRWGVIHKRLKKAISSGASRVSKVLEKKRAKHKKLKKEKAKLKKQRAEAKRKSNEQNKELARANGYGTDPAGMKKFNDVRRTTLTSHDPATIAKGMHTLTDSELKSKINRMKLESEVMNIVEDRDKKANEAATRAANLAKARNEVKSSSIMGQIAKTSGTSIVTNAGKKATDKIFDEVAKQVLANSNVSEAKPAKK